MSDAQFAGAVDSFLRSQCVPARRSEPRVAPRFASVEPWRVPVPEGTLAAWRLGDGPAVLLVHGWRDDHTLWSPLIDALDARGRSLVAFDMPAHGLSDGEWGLQPEAVDGLWAITAALGPIDAIVGHSSGAGTAELAISEGLDADRAVFVAPPFRPGHNRWLRQAERQGISEEIAVAAQKIYEEKVGPERMRFDLCAALPALETKILVVHSVDDEHMPYRDTQAVVARCANAELFEVAGLSHRRTARDPDVVSRIADFVQTST